MIETPEIVRTAARPTAVIHLTIPRSEMRQVMGPAHTELMATLAGLKIAPVGPWFAHHFRMDPNVFDFELGVPVDGPILTTGRVTGSQLPAAIVARTVYRGGYEGLGAAWGELDAWIKASGHTPRADLWECYAAGPETSPDPASWRTQLNRPLAEHEL
jgi:effector-binding domain-containing protein